MGKLTIEINTENAAFEDDIGYEVSFILLREVIEGAIIRNGYDSSWVSGLQDSNGNGVGEIRFDNIREIDTH